MRAIVPSKHDILDPDAVDASECAWPDQQTASVFTIF